MIKQKAKIFHQKQLCLWFVTTISSHHLPGVRPFQWSSDAVVTLLQHVLCMQLFPLLTCQQVTQNQNTIRPTTTNVYLKFHCQIPFINNSLNCAYRQYFNRPSITRVFHMVKKQDKGRPTCHESTEQEQRHSPAKRPGTHCTGDLMGPRATLERCGKSCSHQGSNPELSSPQELTILNMLTQNVFPHRPNNTDTKPYL